MGHLNIITKRKNYQQVEVVIYLKEGEKVTIGQVKEYGDIFGQVTVLSKDDRDPALPDAIKWKTCSNNVSKTECWNKAVAQSSRSWILFLEYSETIDFSSFPDETQLNPKKWIPALFLSATGKTTLNQVYQIRLVPKTEQVVFGGKNIPDPTQYIFQNRIDIISVPFQIFRKKGAVADADPDDEMSVLNYSPQLYLIAGNQYLENRKYAQAAAQYRHLLRMERLLPFDRLAALNGLASCMTEMFKWADALRITEKSIDLEPFQFLPYLIRYRIYQLNKQWKKSLHALEMFYDVLNKHFSKASHDKFIVREHVLLKLGKVAINAGEREKALSYYSEYDQSDETHTDAEFLHMLLVLAIELCDYQKSVHYFGKIFDGRLEGKLDQDTKESLNEYLAMFMVNGWYDYPFEIYDRLYEADSNDGEYRRRLIVTLTRTNRIDRAKRLIAMNL